MCYMITYKKQKKKFKSWNKNQRKQIKITKKWNKEEIFKKLIVRFPIAN